MLKKIAKLSKRPRFCYNLSQCTGGGVLISMKSILRKSMIPHGVIVAVLLFVVLISGVALASRAQAASLQRQASVSGQRLITIYEQGQERSILTRATTLRKAFEEAQIPIDSKDLVEPGLDDQLVANSYDVNIYRARPVTIVDGATRLRVMTPYQTAKQIVDQAGMVLHDEDKTSMTLNTDIVSEGAGIQLTIDRATPFTLELYGKSVIAYTQTKTVAEMMKSKNITLGPDDTISVPQSSPMTPNMTVEIWRNGVQTATQEQGIPFTTRQVQNTDQPVGYKQVQTPGIPGKELVTYQIVMKNGQEVSRSVIQTVVTQQPGDQVEVIGTKSTNTFSGDFASALARLRTCEAGGNYANTHNPTYRGAYQYDYSTWANYGGFYDPASAPAAIQDQKAWLTYQARGWKPWPACSVSQGLQDVYR